MNMRKVALQSTCLVSILLALAAFVGNGDPYAGKPPKNLRVTGVTDWTVDLRWDAPNGPQPASYVVQCSTGHSMTVPGSQTSLTFSGGFSYLRTYSFRAYAVNASGSWSSASNTVTATLLNDTTPPTKPEVSATGTGPTHVDLAWSCFDASPNLRFDIFVNDQLQYGQVAGNSRRMIFLSPNTTYSFKVRARDSGGNWSEMSDPFVVTTPSADPNDKQPPTTPPGLSGGIIDGGIEAMITFGDSTDNVTPQDLIRYYVYLNGVLDGATIRPYPLQFFHYLEPGIINTIEVVAVDEAGNRSKPATMIIDLRSP